MMSWIRHGMILLLALGVLAGAGGAAFLPCDLALQGLQFAAVLFEPLAERVSVRLRLGELVEDLGIAGDDLVEEIEPVGEVGKAGGLEQDLERARLGVLVEGEKPLGDGVLLLGEAGLGLLNLCFGLFELGAGEVDAVVDAMETRLGRFEPGIEGEELAGDLALALLDAAKLALNARFLGGELGESLRQTGKVLV